MYPRGGGTFWKTMMVIQSHGEKKVFRERAKRVKRHMG